MNKKIMVKIHDFFDCSPWESNDRQKTPKLVKKTTLKNFDQIFRLSYN